MTSQRPIIAPAARFDATSDAPADGSTGDGVPAAAPTPWCENWVSALAMPVVADPAAPSGAWAVWEAQRHRIDGGLQIGGWWGNKAVTKALEEARIPVLDFDVDAVDGNTWDDDRMRRIVTELIEERVAPLAAQRRQ